LGKKDTEISSRLYQLKLKLKKITSFVHVIFGLLLAALIDKYPVASALLLAAFAGYEIWEDIALGKKGDSYRDFWEVLASFAVGMAVVLTLNMLGVYPK
jgi:hypothetical protein